MYITEIMGKDHNITNTKCCIFLFTFRITVYNEIFRQILLVITTANGKLICTLDSRKCSHNAEHRHCQFKIATLDMVQLGKVLKWHKSGITS